MKKSTEDFLINLENNTSIVFNWAHLKPTEKFVQKNDQAVESDTLSIDDGKLVVMVFSCGCETCQEILCVQIFYGLAESSLSKAESVKNEILRIVPNIPVEIFNLFDLKSIA
jgi:hypothetical protein